ncbi:hypothetical protein GIB67_006392 [Kingdonia uniflora]|uniref:Cytochrome P450 n=1 Tax=Kingdonia uniflora TaxID=39325 RepID=A0A7J7P0Q0_9MAGN|nr:hypothetical protein GIB67_006392 [Kingdonia uniflora]
MKTHDLIFSSRPHASFLNRLLYGKDIAFAPYGEYWRQTRKICVLQLLSTHKVQSYRTVREEETVLMIQKISESCSLKFDLSKMMISFTNDIICRVTLGRKYFGDHESGEMVKKFVYLVGAFNVGDFIPRLSWVNNFNGLEKRVEKNFRELDCFLDGVIEEHVCKKLRKDGSGFGEDGEDFVDVLLGVKESSIGVPFFRDNIKAIVMVISLSFSSYSHICLRYCQFISNGWPVGFPVIINAWAIGRDPVSWEDPEEFRPKRFLNSTIDYKGYDFVLIPFREGRRGCPGTMFAIANVELGLANLLYSFDRSLPVGLTGEKLDMGEIFGVSVHKKDPLVVIATPHLIKTYRSALKTNLNMPPSPTRLPIIGNLHQLGTFPHRNLQNLAKKHGPLMLIHLGQYPTLIISSADTAREIMKTQDHIFSSRPHISFPERLFYGKDIAFAPYGEYWKQARKICVLQLLTAHKVQSYRTVREEETVLMIKKISESCSLKFDLSKVLISFTNDIICRVALGRKYFGDDESGKRMRKMLKEFVSLADIFNIGDFIPRISWVNNFNGLEKRIEKCFKEVDCFLDGVIEEHICKNLRKDGSGFGEDGEDFVDVLLGVEESSIGVPFSRDHIKAIVMDMFEGGTDTVCIAIEWAMTELIRHPHIMKEVQEEIREIMKFKPKVEESDLNKIQHSLQLVIKETLRLHPPISVFIRESLENTKIQGYNIPAKTRVIINAWAIGRDPVSWEDPEEFRPKRFLNSTIDYKGRDFELTPFGAGKRGCPAIMFTIANVELALANLLYQFDWTLPGGLSGEKLDMAETFGVSVHKKDPLVLIATPYLIKT